MSRLILEFDSDELAAASAWHDGQGSMLYAIASTGALSLGTRRPVERNFDADPSDRYARHSRPLTDLEWKRSLVERLESEASEACEWAREADSDPDYSEHVEPLESIERKCREWLDANPEGAS